MLPGCIYHEHLDEQHCSVHPNKLEHAAPVCNRTTCQMWHGRLILQLQAMPCGDITATPVKQHFVVYVTKPDLFGNSPDCYECESCDDMA